MKNLLLMLRVGDAHDCVCVCVCVCVCIILSARLPSIPVEKGNFFFRPGYQEVIALSLILPRGGFHTKELLFLLTVVVVESASKKVNVSGGV